MRKTLFALAALLVAVTASAAEGGKPFLGAGIAIGGGSFDPFGLGTGGGATKILVPMNVAPGIRIEPFIAYSQQRIKDSTSPIGDDLNWASRLTLGASAVLTKDVGNNAELYGGGKLSIVRLANGFENKSVTPNTSGDDSFIGFGIAAVGGAEYYFSPRFAIGVEGELGYESVEFTTDVKEAQINLGAFLTARVYFM